MHTLVDEEAGRLLQLTPARARLAFGDRVARAFLLNQPASLHEFRLALDFNAMLATELRARAERRRQQTIWETWH